MGGQDTVASAAGGGGGGGGDAALAMNGNAAAYSPAPYMGKRSMDRDYYSKRMRLLIQYMVEQGPPAEVKETAEVGVCVYVCVCACLCVCVCGDGSTRTCV
jgi:hypothetical protein